ncbi:HIT family protein [Aquirufa antheringensis]|uniref:HIT family protein n=1 Tax=Aquirufa antheringensis TaxID=2516559 RepID=UPI0022A82311|nr:HIT family protein [Aquirufa antheringensis]MCZ2477466.1 HIT family protein [Aquirufa antheringensis]
MSTIFTKIVNKEIPCHLIKEDDRFLAFLDVMPLVEGHVLVIPKQEIDYFFDLEPELLGDLMKFAQTIAPAIKKAIPCKRVGVAVIGLEVPHAHVHLVPMNRMLDINFSQEKMKPSAESLAKTAELIRSFLL